MMINNAGNVFQLCISTKRKQKLHNLERSKWALVQINMRVTLIKTGPGKEVAFTILINLKDNCVYITRSIIAHFSRRPRRLHFKELRCIIDLRDFENHSFGPPVNYRTQHSELVTAILFHAPKLPLPLDCAKDVPTAKMYPKCKN